MPDVQRILHGGDNAGKGNGVKIGSDCEGGEYERRVDPFCYL